MTKFKDHNRCVMLYFIYFFLSLGLILVTLLPVENANAATNIWYVATSGNDANSCDSPITPCATLQSAVDKAASDDTILAASDIFSYGFSLSKDLYVSGGWNLTFTIQEGMTTIDPTTYDGGIYVSEGITAEIEHFKVMNATGVWGAGVENRGNLSLSDCIITNNNGFHGSGIFNSGTMTISNCSIDHNYDAYYGGGVYNEGDMTILHSSIDHNNSSNAAGIYNGNQYRTSPLEIKDSTIWANQAGTGGGIQNSSVLTMTNTTIAENISDWFGGIYYTGDGPYDHSLIINNCSIVNNKGYGLAGNSGSNIHLQNTMIVKNTLADALNLPFLDGYNLVGSIVSLEGGYIGPGNLIGVHQTVYPLEGWPAYAPLYQNSLAIDRGDPNGCRDNEGSLLETDMRGLPRYGRCDIGAYELQPIEQSTFIVNHYQPRIDSVITYKLVLVNSSTDEITSSQVVNELPGSFTYIPDSLWFSSGSASIAEGIISWEGSIDAGQSISIQYQVNVGTATGIITNTATITTNDEIFNRIVLVQVTDKYFTNLPCVSKPCPPSFFDDFSNISSGWSIESGNTYSMGYKNGEYFIIVNPGWMAWSLQDFGVSDYQVEVDTRPRVSLDGASGIIFAVTDNGFYEYIINDGWYSLWRVDIYSDWYWTPLIDWTYSPAIHPGLQSNRLKIIRTGTNITLYANSVSLGSVSDGHYTSTWVGMVSEAYNSSYDGRFDNFTLYTGSCIGSKSATMPMMRGTIFDGMWLKPGTGPYRPDR